MVAYHIPFREMVFGGLTDGWALWNPYLFNGTPLYATGFQSPFHPLTGVAMLLPTSLEIKLTILLCGLSSALGMFALLRSRGCSVTSAGFGGFWFAFGADWISRAYAGHLSILLSFAHWPWFAWAVLRCFRAESSFRHHFLAALVFALALLSGNYNYLYLMLVWTIALSLGEAPFRHWLLSWLKVGGLGMSLSAVHWVPLLFILPETSRAAGSFDFALAGGAPTWTFLSWLSPVLLQGQAWWSFPSWEGQHYLGLLPLGLALIGAREAFPEKKRLGFSIVGFGLLACGDSTPVYRLLFELDPLLHRFRGPSRFGVLVTLAIIWFAVRGLGALERRRPTRRESALLILPLAGALVLCLFAETVVPGFPTEMADRLKWESLPALLLGIVGVCALHLIPRQHLYLSLILLCVLDLRLVAQPWLGAQEEASYRIPPAMVARIEEDPGARVQFDPGLRWHNRALGQGLSQPDGYERLVNNNYMEAVSAALDVELGTTTLLSTFASGPFWDLQGARYAISPGRPPAENMEEVASEAGLTLYRNPAAKDRAFLVYQVELGAGAATRAGVGSGELDASQQAFVAEEDFEEALTHLGSSADQPSGEVLSFVLRNNWLWVRYRSNVPALLVVTDSPFPGWTARLDGQPVACRSANGELHRTVLVPAGEHELEMNYWPRGLTFGALLSALCLGLCLWAVRRDFITCLGGFHVVRTQSWYAGSKEES